MTIYQKAIKLRKICEIRKTCDDCIYRSKCDKSDILLFAPADEDLKDVAKAIKDEKWIVK